MDVKAANATRKESEDRRGYYAVSGGKASPSCHNDQAGTTIHAIKNWLKYKYKLRNDFSKEPVFIFI